MARKPGIEALKKKLSPEEFRIQKRIYEAMWHWYVGVGLNLIETRANVLSDLRDLEVTITIARFRELLDIFQIEKPKGLARKPVLPNGHFCS